MSGIAGIVGNVDDLEYHLAAMMRSQQHRGEVGGGFWVSSFAEEYLGMACCNRVVGEMEEYVRQPFVDEDTRLVVMADCDIYNYKDLKVELQSKYTFVTDSSIEVISKAYRFWGNDFLKKLKGAFAIVIYDRLKNLLLIARDRFGVKPLYYTTRRGVLYFASEVRSIFLSGIRAAISIERCASYLVYSTYGPGNTTFWEGIYQLPAGMLLEYNGFSLLEKRWYELHDDVAVWVERCEDRCNVDFFVDMMESCVGQSLSDVSCCGLRVATRIESQLLYSIVKERQYGWKIYAYTSNIENVGRHPDATPVGISECDVLTELERMSEWVEEPFDGHGTLLRMALFRQARRDGVRLLCSAVGLDVLWQELWDVGGVRYNYRSTHSIFSSYLASYSSKPCYGRYFCGEVENNCYSNLCIERIPHILRFLDRMAAEVGVSLRLPFFDNDLVALSFVLPLLACKSKSRVFLDVVSPRYRYETQFNGVDNISRIRPEGLIKEWAIDVVGDLCRGRVREWFDVKSMEKLRNSICENRGCDEYLLWKCISLHRMLGMEEMLKNII
jgi:asparagine synthase (glutamine-hydrolysing)